MHFIALDIESTGPNPKKDRIIQLHMRGVTWPDLRSTWVETQLVNPGIPIPPDATVIHGFDDATVAECLPFASLAPGLRDRFDEPAIIIAYNGRRFDVPLLHHEFIRSGVRGLTPNLPIIDPYELFIQDSPRTLTGAMRYYLKEDHKRAHDAESDVEAMLKVLKSQLLRRSAVEVWENAIHPDHVRLDVSGCFYRDTAGVIRFGFGKHRDQPAAAHPAYLKWILRSDFDEDAKKCAKDCLECVAAAA